MLQDLESKLARIEQILREMQELARRAADRTVDSAERQHLQEVFDENIAAIDRIGNTLIHSPSDKLDS